MAVVEAISAYVAFGWLVVTAGFVLRRRHLREQFMTVHGIYGEQASARLALQLQRTMLLVRALWPVFVTAWCVALALEGADIGPWGVAALVAHGMSLTALGGALLASSRMQLPPGHARPVVEVIVHDEATAGR